MEPEEGGDVIHVWKQAVSRGNSLDIHETMDIRRQLGIHEVETIGGELFCM